MNLCVSSLDPEGVHPSFMAEGEDGMRDGGLICMFSVVYVVC